ncbi:drug/metabolite transporter superfamily protein [Nitzschia inconspicua]|uniref:Drug/metabolite transporter superfamily protein n=1 Tax=Nitzschia inconspicua TaxID=303405 RepID=A0A9K3LMF5_9STRA|nr:drug/metabolite transporter superfamily protein [Nitzschia inconspicua]
MPSIFDTCTDACGWIAAPIASLSYGSFGVPIRGTKHIPVHPLMMQSYKTLMMFLTCWAVTFLGVEIAFTRWGLLSGFLWVVGGTGGIYGIRMAGLAIAVGTWASIMVMINFLFGIVIFREPVADVFSTLCSFVLLIVGLVGMSRYSAPPPKEVINIVGPEEEIPQIVEHESTNYQSMVGDAQRNRIGDTTMEETRHDAESASLRPSTNDAFDSENLPHLVLFSGRISLTKRQCGILGASVNGVMTGGSLVPVHYAAEEGFGGAKFFPSMACGAILSNLLIWGVFFCFQAIRDSRRGKTMRQTVDEMPKPFFRELWFPASLAGLLLSLAMFTSIISVTYLGQGVGNSLIQSKILVSGLWGIFWYHEIKGAATIAKWFASAGICMLAIIWLSIERLEAKAGGHRMMI